MTDTPLEALIKSILDAGLLSSVLDAAQSTDEHGAVIGADLTWAADSIADALAEELAARGVTVPAAELRHT